MEALRLTISIERKGIEEDGKGRNGDVHWTVVKRLNVPICENSRTGSWYSGD